MRPRLLGLLLVAGLPLVGQGCGSKFDLPTETRTGRGIPTDKSYQILSTWTGMTGVTDILLTQGIGSQLFILFKTSDTDTINPRGKVQGFPLTRKTPLLGIDFPTLFDPVAMCSGNNRVYVLDEGDTCLARSNPITNQCSDTTGRWNLRVRDLSRYWRVREYGLLGGDTLSTFTDTTVAFVRGIAADAAGNVYVSGTAILKVPDQLDPYRTERQFHYRVYRYIRGPRYPGVDYPDRNMPGASWHRDTTWEIEEGSGIGTLVDPHGLFWSAAGGTAVYAADFGKNWVQKLSDVQTSAGYYQLDGGQSDTLFTGPTDVTVDLSGFVYIADPGNRRVLRYDPDGTFIQRVNVETEVGGHPLASPVAIAADDSLVYVADQARAEVVRYKRRK